MRAREVEAALASGDVEAVARMGALRPLGHEVLIERDSFPDRTEGGLFVPERAKDQFAPWATVLAVGSDVKGVDVQRGDRVAVDMGKMVRYVRYRNGAVPDSRIGFVDVDLIDARELREGET